MYIYNVYTLGTIRSVCGVSIIKRAQTMMKGDVKENPLIYRGKGKYNHDIISENVFLPSW